ncbi:MAG: universal stress protein [Chloroflexi bacterium]|nr:universal stress protein [Chloroflexota bacterium]
MYSKILVPLDGSELSEAVLAHVRTIARCMNAEVLLVRVPVVLPYDYNIIDPELISSLEANAKSEIQAYLEKQVALLQAEGINARMFVGEGLVADTLLQLADSERCDLICMSTHGRSGFARLLMGSVADKVVHGAKIPVLLIRPLAHMDAPPAAPAGAP